MNAQGRYQKAYFDTVATQRGPFAALVKQRAVMLTTYRRDGRAVGTPVNIAVESDHAYIRTWDSAWKTKRILRSPEVELVPCTMSGKLTGPSMHARAHLIEGEEAKHAAGLIERKHRILQGIMVPLTHKLRHQKTVHFRLTAA